MSEKLKRLLLLLLCVCSVASLAVLPGGAVKIKDPAHPVTLRTEFRYDGTPISGAPFSIYYVANVYVNVNYDVSFALSGGFKKYHVSLKGLQSSDWAAAAVTLTGYVKRDKPTPYDTGVTGADGSVTFPSARASMDQGLYLVIGDPVRKEDGYVYTPKPFLISVPNLDPETGDWIYDVAAAVKYSRVPEEEYDKSLSRRVLKIWEGDEEVADLIRPEDVTIRLFMDDQEYDTVLLNEGNGWAFQWNDLPGGHQWYVAEDEVDFYVTSVSEEGLTYVVKNKYSDTEIPDPPLPHEDLPQTGAVRWPVYALAAGGLVVFLIGLVIYRRHED